MPDPIHCPECGAALTPGQPQDLCARCALKGALEFSNDDTEPISPSPPIPEAGERIGRYKLLEKIGEGGCGIVYMADQEGPIRRRVALKIIKLGMDTKEVIARFEAERQALALMDHPHIAKIFDGGATESGRPYFVMELVRGLRITDYCDQKNLSTRQRLDLFMQVCQAVQHAHQKGIIHRDLKPSNILVTVNDGVPVPKVIDFGIAKATGQRLTDKTLFTKFEQLLGTPAYMSPEQAELTSVDIDTRSDIYSLGVLLYELLTGRVSFDSKELMAAGFEEMLRTIREREPARPSARLQTLTAIEQATVAQRRNTDPPKLLNLVRGDLDWIVMKCLEKDRARRYETASGLAMDLQRHLDQEPVLARSPTTAYRVRKFVRRNKGLVAATASITLVLVLGVVISAQQSHEATKARAGEAEQRKQAEAKAAAESLAKEDANRERARAEDALSFMEIQRVQDLLTTGDSASALAHLAHLLRQNPTNRIAAQQLISLLTLRNYVLRLGEPLRHERQVHSAQFSPDGQRVVTASRDKSARVWDARTGQALTEPLQYEAAVRSAEFSPDGQRVVTASDGIGREGGARVWDAQTGLPLTELLGDLVRSAQFSPDGQRVVTASGDKTARVWDARTGQPLTKPLKHEGGEGWVVSALFSPDGQRVVTASGDATARVWDARTGQPLTEPLKHKRIVLSAQFSPDGQRVVTASFDKTARVWDSHTGQPLTEPLKHEDALLSARFSPDGQQVVTASGDRTARVWDARTGQPLTEPLRHDGGVYSAQFSPDGQSVVTASGDKTARVWDARTGQALTEPFRHGSEVKSAQFSSNGKWVVTTSEDNNARVWDARTGQALTEPLRHDKKISSAQFSSDGQRVVTASDDGTARVWDARTSQRLSEPLKPGGGVYSAQFSPDGQRVFTTGWSARIWDVRTGQPLTDPIHKQSGLPVRSAQFSPDGQWVVTASEDKTARVWDAHTGQPLTEPLIHASIVQSAQFSPDGQRVVTASGDQRSRPSTTGEARVWDARTGLPLTKPIQHGAVVWSAQFSPDGQRVVTASWDKSARVWDARTGQPVTEPLQHDSEVYSAQFSPDGQRLVTASWDKTARVWDARTGQPLTEPLRHNGRVESAQFSPDGQRVVTASWDKTARVWDARTGLPLAEPLKHEGVIQSARFSPDGQRVVTASHDQTARVWSIPDLPLPVAPWVPELAEAIAHKRINTHRLFESVPEEEFLKLRRALEQSNSQDFYSRWAKWFYGDRNTRTISPFSTTTIPEFVQHRIEENTLESLREAIKLNPTNGLAFARLARQTLAQADKENPRRVGEADFFSRRAVELSSNDPEVQRIRAEIVEQIKNIKEP